MTTTTIDHEPIESMTDAELQARIELLEGWPKDYADAIDNDPRCGCDPDCPLNNITRLLAVWES